MIFLLFNRQIFLIILLVDFFDISRSVVSCSVASVIQLHSRSYSVVSRSVISCSVVRRSVVAPSVLAPVRFTGGVGGDFDSCN